MPFSAISALSAARREADAWRVKPGGVVRARPGVDLPDMDSFTELVLEQMRSVPALTWRRMFGGCGFYAGGLFFAMVWDDRLFLKAGEADREGFRARGMGPFTYEGGALHSLWEVPAEVLEDADELARWATRAIAAARAAKLAKAGRSPRRRGKRR